MGSKKNVGVIVGVKADKSSAALKEFKLSTQSLADRIKPKVVISVDETASKNLIKNSLQKIVDEIVLNGKSGVSLKGFELPDVRESKKATAAISSYEKAVVSLAVAKKRLSQAEKIGGEDFAGKGIFNELERDAIVAQTKVDLLRKSLSLTKVEMKNIHESAEKTSKESLIKISEADFRRVKESSAILKELYQRRDLLEVDKASLKTEKKPFEDGSKKSSTNSYEYERLEKDLTRRINANTTELSLNAKAISQHENILRRFVKNYSLSGKQIKEINKDITESTTYISENTAHSYAKLNKTMTSAQGSWKKWLSSNGNIFLKSDKSVVGKVDEINKAFESIGKGIEEGKPLSGLNNDLVRAQTLISEVKSDAESKGLTGNTIFDSLYSGYKKFGSWTLITRSLAALVRQAKQLYKNVVEIETAMTELKKVTDETSYTYDRFLKNAAARAKDLGATMTDIIYATADYARLGYNIEEASELADAATVYKNVGDGINDINDASESLISTMQAFGVEASDVMGIVDKFNNIGNKFPISSKGVGEAMKRSSAALAAAGNTLDESIALATAMNVVIQDPEKVGTTLKTVSMFLRAAKTDAEDAGIEVDGMASSVSKLREELLQLTGGRVDIQLDDDTFKSTYQILKEISYVWGDLSDISQANITNLLGGKRNANAILAIMGSFETAEKALQESMGSAGSAMAENEVYLDSIEGRSNQLKASFEALSASVLNSSLIKNATSFITGILDLLTKIIDQIGVMPSLILGVSAAASVAFATMKSGLSDGTRGLGKIIKTLIAKGTKDGEEAIISLSSLGKGLFKALKTPIGIAIAGIAATAIGYNIAKSRAEKVHKEAEESILKLREYESELESINARIDANKEEISTLESKDTLSSIEEDRLEFLKEQTEQLQQQSGIYDILVEKAKLAAGISSAESFKKKKYNKKGEESTFFGSNIADSMKKIGKSEQEYKSLISKGYDKWKKNREEYRIRDGDVKITDLTMSEEAYADVLKKEEEFHKKRVTIAAKYALEAQKYLSENRGIDPEADKLAENALRTYYENFTSMTERFELIKEGNSSFAEGISSVGKFKSALEELNETKGDTSIYSLVNTINGSAKPSFEEAKGVIAEFASSTIPNLDEHLKATGISMEDFVEHTYNMIFASKEADDEIKFSFLDEITNRLQSLTSETQNTALDIEDLYTAYNKSIEGTSMSAKEIFNLVGKYNELSSSITKTSDGYTIESFAIEKVINAKKASIELTIQEIEADMRTYLINTGESYNFLNKTIRENMELRLTDLKISLKQAGGYNSLAAGIANLSLAFSSMNGNVKQYEKDKAKVSMFNSNKKIYDEIKEIEKLINAYDAANFAKNITFSPSSYSSSSSKASNTKASNTKEDRVKQAKDAFDAEYSLLKHHLEMNYITEKEYYNRLDALYKRFFEAGTEYYRQYEEEVYKGRKKLLEQAKSDLDSLLSDVQNVIKQRKKDQIDALKEQLDAYKTLADARKQALTDLKDEAEYTKTVAEKRKEVALLESRYSEAQRDNSAQGVKKQKELFEELTKAKTDLSKYEYEHSVEVQKNAIDAEIKTEQEKTDKKIEVLQSFLDNQSLIVQASLNEINGMSDSLYNSLIEWNRVYGTGIDLDITQRWNAAKQALLDYGSIANAQGTYNKISNAVANNTTLVPSSSSGSVASSPSPSYSGGSITSGGRVEASPSAKIYTSKNGTALRQYFRSNPKYIVLSSDGDWVKVRHISARSGVTGWFKSSDLKAYAKGTNKVLEDGLAITQEAGSELIMHDGSMLTPLSRGDMVFNNESSQRLWELANKPDNNWLLNGLNDRMQDIRTNTYSNHKGSGYGVVNINFGDTIIEGNADEAVLGRFRKSLVEDIKGSLNKDYFKKGLPIKVL